ncbi:aryl-alcohol dehydrogenase-like predicted oxidoreductase [Pullulanibacillus pueri]|uniref:Aldo/keto reductase n=1 Tax=Pullulanibacillus pueri TaxID=1437324 RepID=A0A8J2ZZI0_9BACL|nr:aldo/keto reductase [Pullulanibacillus pueri]MBM7684237.1 aryl-alcohol dehydrogenase-like predicted oxidoreductase [Pullulanibacillus pueri]GGH87471.1 aldo/keto reductase [Pullulanibacillus pueri]
MITGFATKKLSPIAIGTHLGEMNHEDSLKYQEALVYALTHGINFIDTALNYRGMKSERDIGVVLRHLISETGKYERSECFISTKAGIIPGDIDAGLVPKAYLQKKLIEPGIISVEDLHVVGHQKHILTPRYYDFAIEQSRMHMGLETIDLHYIHNPELSIAVLGPERFYKQLETLFTFYETKIEEKKLRYYGMASWDAFLLNPSEKGFISLEKVIQIAHAVAGEHHHFKFIQLPFNLFNTAAATTWTQSIQGRRFSAIEAANRLGLTVTVSAPLAQGKAFSETKRPEDFLQFVLDHPGVTAAMVGMKQKSHVQKNLALLSLYP